MSLNEANTRKVFIDRALETAGWNLADLNEGTELEHTVSNRDTLHKQWAQIMDQCLVKSIMEDVSRLPDLVYEDSRRRDSLDLCLSSRLRTATPEELNRAIADLADQMKNRRECPSSFVEIDLADRIAISGYITSGEGGEQVYVEEYRRRVEAKVLEIVETHPTMAAIRYGEAVTDLQLVALKRTLRQELGGGNVQLSESNIRKAFNLKVCSFLSFLRELLEIEGLSDYQDVVKSC